MVVFVLKTGAVDVITDPCTAPGDVMLHLLGQD